MVSGEQGGVGGSPGTPTDQPITGPGFAEIVSSNFNFPLLLNLSLCNLHIYYTSTMYNFISLLLSILYQLV